jgi:hypothetical protein
MRRINAAVAGECCTVSTKTVSSITCVTAKAAGTGNHNAHANAYRSTIGFHVRSQAATYICAAFNVSARAACSARAATTAQAASANGVAADGRVVANA